MTTPTCKHRWEEVLNKQKDLASSHVYKCTRCGKVTFVP